ncbi:hypothetical protein CLIM01_01116 [Colletotrichum limetticola]|uniref:Uncharacterized protein n=1 Tax=Colletotrichum limetticola TaxID=1209924 RepID=A0ABQ9QCG9_9PEZI|nr:hypothetical protein CLIM01_01116 [Colletotrichum limetticola]
MNRKSAREQTITSRGVNSWDRQGWSICPISRHEERRSRRLLPRPIAAIAASSAADVMSPFRTVLGLA